LEGQQAPGDQDRQHKQEVVKEKSMSLESQQAPDDQNHL